MNFLEGYYNITPLIPCIQLLGNGVKGVEVGVQRAESLCTVLQNCSNIEKMYAVDNWQPYTESLGENTFFINQQDSELAKLIALHNIKWSGFENKVTIVEKNSLEAVEQFDNEYFDLIFLDSYGNELECMKELSAWYPKLRHGGLFCGHDSSYDKVKYTVEIFRDNNNIDSPLSIFADTWCWKKQ